MSPTRRELAAQRRASADRQCAKRVALAETMVAFCLARRLDPERIDRWGTRRWVFEESHRHERDWGLIGRPDGTVWKEVLRIYRRYNAELAAAREDERRCVDPAWRAEKCPRPDKDAWLTREGAEHVVTVMREAGRPRAEDLHAYLCEAMPGPRPGCGAWHVGDATRFPAVRSAQEVKG